MKTITPFKQLVSSEIERLRSIAVSRIPTQQLSASFPALSDSYTMKRMTLCRERKGLLARVFGN